MNDGSVIVRMARRAHQCHGGHDGKQRRACHVPILPNTIYIEYIGETPGYQSGARYHVDCAVEQGLVERIEGAPRNSKAVAA